MNVFGKFPYRMQVMLEFRSSQLQGCTSFPPGLTALTQLTHKHIACGQDKSMLHRKGDTAGCK